MNLDPRIIKQLQRTLERELRLYIEYVAVLAEEQKFVVALKADQVTSLTQRRGQIIEQLDSLRQSRSSIIEEISGRESITLSEFVEEFCLPADKKKLQVSIAQIKQAIRDVEERSREFNQILNFSLGLVNGEISLLWSASQSVSRVYNAFGAVQEAVQPSAPRAGSLLGEA